MLLGIISLMLACVSSAVADDLTWWGLGSTANWSDTTNWLNLASAYAAPANTDNLIFANPSPQATANNDLGSLTVSSLTLTSGNFDLTGNLLTISTGITNTANDNVFDLPVVLSAPQAFEVDGSSLTFNNALTNGANALTIQGTGNVTWNLSPTNGIKGTGNLVMNSSGTLTVNGGFSNPGIAYAWTGATIVNAGTFQNNVSSWSANSAVGSSLTVNPGAIFNNNSVHFMSYDGRPMTNYGGTINLAQGGYVANITISNGVINGPGAMSCNLSGLRDVTSLAAASQSTIAAGITLSTAYGAPSNIGSRIFNVADGAADPDLECSGTINGPGSLTKTNLGRLLISGTASYGGNTIISAGTLSLSGTLPNSPVIIVASNAVFDISGTSLSLSANQMLSGVGMVIGTLNDNNVVSGSAVSPAGNGTAGTLTMGGLFLNGNVNLNFDLANTTGVGGGTNDLLVVTNLIANAGVTNVVNISFLNGTPQIGGYYTLIQYGNGFSGDPSQFLTAAASRYVYTFTNDTTAGAIKVLITGTPGSLVWKGDGTANVWDAGVTTNWFNGAPVKDVFLQGDNATFNDLGSNTPSINVSAALQPTVLTVNAVRDYTFAGNGKITGGGSLVKANSGNLTILTPNDNTGNNSINGTGTVTMGNGSTLGALGAGNLTNNSKLVFYRSDSFTYAGNISGSGSVNKLGAGTLTLPGSNTFTGPLIINNGTVQIGNNPTVSAAVTTGPITNYGILYISRTDAFTNKSLITSAGITRQFGSGELDVRGVGGMTVDGTAPISLGGNLNIGNGIYGKLTINPGASVTVGNTMNIGASGSISGDVIQNGGTLNINGNGTVKILSIGLYGTEISTYSMLGGTLNIPYATIDVGSDGIGLMTMTNGTVNCRGLSIDNNGYTGSIGGTNSTFTMTGGLLNIGASGISGATQTNTVVPTILLSGGTIAAVDPAGFSSAMFMRLTNGTPTIDTTNATVILSGVLSGNGGLTKQGSGVLQLDATNTFANTLTVSQGILQGGGVVSAPVIVQSGAVLSAGGTLARGTLTFSNNVTVNSGARILIDQASTALSSDLIKVVGGTLALNSTPININFTGGTPYTGGTNIIITNTVPRTGTVTYANPTRYAVNLDQSNPNFVQISFSGSNAPLVWNGNVSQKWNVNADANWLNAGLADKYFQSDVVIFGDGATTKNVVLASNMTPASVTVDAAANYTFSGSDITGVATLTKSGSGTLIVSNNLAYTGATTVAAGALQIGNNGTSGSISGSILDNSSVVFKRLDSITYGGVISGGGTLTQAGGGTLLLAANQTYLGGSTINSGGTIQLGNGVLANAGSLGAGPVTNSGTLAFFQSGTPTFANNISGNGTLNFLGTGISGQSGYTLSGSNSFTGPVNLTLARLQPGNAASFGGASSITVPAGSGLYVPVATVFSTPLNLNGSGWWESAGLLGAVRLGGGANWAGNITLSGNTRISSYTDAGSNVISGNISGGSYELEAGVASGTGLLILAPTSANTFGSLRLSPGTLRAYNAGAIPSGIPLIMNGGTLQLNGNNVSFSDYSALANGTFQNNSAVNPATLSLTLNSLPASFPTISDGSTKPLNVTLNFNVPGISYTNTASLTSWTGNLTNNGGTFVCGSTTGSAYLGVNGATAAGRSIVGNNGATFVTTINNTLNGYAGSVVLNKSTWNLIGPSSAYNSFAPAGSLYLAGSTLTGSGSTSGSAYEMLQLPGTVTVRGTAPSYMLGTGNSSAYDVQSVANGGTTFDVADVAVGPDLIVGGGTNTTFLHSPANTSSGGSITKTGAGTLELDGPNSYTGSTKINLGTVALGASATLPSTSIIIAGGATFDLGAFPGSFTLATGATLGGAGTVNGSISDNSTTVIQPGGVGVAGTLTITTNLTLGGSGSLNFDLSNNNVSGNDQIVVGGNLTVSGGTPTPVTFNFLNGSAAAGTYTLITAGSISGTVATAFTNISRIPATFSQIGNTVAVTVLDVSSNLVWTGTDPLVAATWDIATTTNWSNGSTGDIFYNLDSVVFNDSSVITNVALVTAVSPASITFNGNSSYTIDNGGYANSGRQITGVSTLTKNGTGTAAIHCIDRAVGPINVNAGILAYNGDDADNAYSGATIITVSNNAAFDFGSAADFDKTQPHTFVVQGSGPDGLGAVRCQVGVTYGIASDSYISNFVLAADATIGGNQRWDIGPMAGSKLDGQGHNLTIVGSGSGQIDLRTQIITNLASITVSNPLTWYESYYQTNAWTTTITNYVMPGSKLGIYGGIAVNLPVVLTNATILNQGGGTPIWLSPITLQGTNVFNNAAAQTFSGAISGPGTIAIGGGGTAQGVIPATLTFSNASSFTGGVIISNAPVTRTNNTAVSGFAAVIVTSSNALGTGPLTFNLSQMTTNFTTNVVRVLECNLTGGVIPNPIVLPTSGVTNLGIQGRDSTSRFTLSGQITGGFTGMTNWVDFGDSGSSGVMRLANNANSFVGNIYCDRGVLAITGDGCLGNAANQLRLDQASANGGLRFDAPGINVVHPVIWNLASTISVLGDNNGDGIPETANNATISGNISIVTAGQALNVGGGTNIAGTSSGSLTLTGSNNINSQITVAANTKIIATSTNAVYTSSGYYLIMNSGATFALNNSGTYASRPIQISGSGVQSGGVGVGALENLSGNNVFPSSVTLNAPSTIGLTSGNLTLNGAISGAYPVTVIGTSAANTLTLNAAETYSAGTIINGGTVLVNGSLAVGNSVNVNTGATLGGSGTINAPVTVYPGATLAPGANAVGKLAVNSTLNLGGITVMEVSKTANTNDLLTGMSTVIYGGTLTVNNLGGSYVAGDSFKLFNSQSYQGTFAATNLPSIAPLVWNWIPTNGTLAVVSGVATNPTNITATVSGNVLTLSWPADHTGWRLLVQTNNLATGISSVTNDWSTVAGSAAINTTNIIIDPLKPTEFYRLIYP